MKIATSAYPLDVLADWDAYAKKLTAWVAEAARQGAELLVFPEYGAMELASLDGPEVAAAMEPALRAVAKYLPKADVLHEHLARTHGVYILAASAPVYDPGPRPVNQARFFGPDGWLGAQDKQIMTMVERGESMDVHPGKPLQVFDTSLGKIGILICYDAEFPDLGRVLAEAGVEIILTPSFTEGVSGYWRVRIGAMARALEGQCITVHSPAVGDGAGCPAFGASTGAAAIYGPPDLGFPDTGVIAEGELNRPGWIYGEIATGSVANVRRRGRVRNFSHWSEQAQRLKGLKLS